MRLNPDVEADTHAYVATGTAQSKFGLGFAEALEALELAAADDALEPVGISFHIGSNLFDLAPIAAAADRAIDLWRAAAGQPESRSASWTPAAGSVCASIPTRGSSRSTSTLGRAS